MATTNTGLLTQANNNPASPAATSIPAAQESSPSQVSVNVSAPGSRSYEGFSENSSYDDKASNFSVSDDSLVENRLTGLLGSNSDYMKRAQSNATVASNRRGLLSSSIAAGAGSAAAIDAALPIAQQDANTFAQSDLTKQGYFNNQSLAEQQAFNTSRLSAQDATQQSGALEQQTESTAALNNQQGQLSENLAASSDNRQLGLQNNQGNISEKLQNNNAGHQSDLSAQQAGEQSALQAQSAAENATAAEQQFNFQKALQTMDEQSRLQLLNIQQQHAQLLQQSQAASNRLQDMAQQIAGISVSPDMNADQKALAIAQLMDLSNNSLATQSALMKAAGIDELSLSGEVTSGSATPSTDAGAGTDTGTDTGTGTNASAALAETQAKIESLNSQIEEVKNKPVLGNGRSKPALVAAKNAEIAKLEKERDALLAMVEAQ